MQTRSFINTQKGTFSEEKSARFCVTNDTLNAYMGMVKWEIRNAKSEILRSGEEEISVAPLSAKYLEKKVFEGLDPETEHLRFVLETDGKRVSEGSVLFTAPKYYAFEAPSLRYEREGEDIIVRSDAYAKSVQIEGVDGDLILEDNFFDMEKGERRVRILSGDAQKLLLRSVYDIR